MADITTTWDALNGRGDWSMAPPGLASGADIEAAVLISLFTDRVADLDDVIPDGTDDPRGWWADAFSDRPIGSKLWLLSRAKGSTSLLNTVRGYIVDALQWLLDDRVCAAIDVVAQWIGPSMIGAQITLHRQGSPPITLNYPNVWQGVS